MKKVCSINANWIFVLMLIIPGTVLHAEDPPSAHDQAAPTVQVPPALHNALANSLGEATSIGTKAIPTPPTGSWGIVSEGDGGGGIFRDSDSEAEAWLGTTGYGVEGFGSEMGGHFVDSDSSGYAYVGFENYGIWAYGNGGGGYFKDIDGTGFALIGYDRPVGGTDSLGVANDGEYGVYAGGSKAGGYFEDNESSGYAYVGYGASGIWARGNTLGGYFKDLDHSGYAYVGFGDRGIEANGTEMGGYFVDSDSSGYAQVGYGDYGIWAYGNTGGGVFQSSGGTGSALIGYNRFVGGTDLSGNPNDGEYGVYAGGSKAGGYFEDYESSGYAYVGYGDRGIQAQGNGAGGFFIDADGSGYGYVGHGDRGVEAYGTEMGGLFKDADGSGLAKLGVGDYGIRAFGYNGGGHFEDSNQSGQADVGHGDRGIDARGTQMGGLFNDSDDSGYARVGFGDRGIEAFGNEMGGYFKDRDGTGFAYAAYDRTSGVDRGGYTNVGEYGLYAGGKLAGAYFEDSDDSAYGYIGSGDYGIFGAGNTLGGYFNDLNSSSYGNVGYETYKIYGTGAVSFIQNHPYDSSSVIVYAAPEGDEVATYTRGSAMLVDGEATVPLGETFKWVTNPDLGLTAFLTPVSEWCDLYIVEQATDSIVVRSRDGSDCSFNFMIYGLRIGFEESSVVQEKEQESYIPSMAGHRQLYERRPDLKSYNSLERFKGMHYAISPKAELDLSRAQALRDAVIEFDPAVHELPKPPGHEEWPADDLAFEDAERGAVQRVRAARGDHDRQPATDQSDLTAAIPVDDEGNIYAPSFRPPSREVATLVDVSEAVEPGDVLVIDRDTAGQMRRGFEGHDSGVVGVALGSQSPAHSGDEVEAETALHAEVAIAGVVKCKVDATYGAIWPGNLLVTSSTAGHAMRTDAPLPGTIVGKALEPLQEGVGTIKVLVMLR